MSPKLVKLFAFERYLFANFAYFGQQLQAKELDDEFFGDSTAR